MKNDDQNWLEMLIKIDSIHLDISPKLDWLET